MSSPVMFVNSKSPEYEQKQSVLSKVFKNDKVARIIFEKIFGDLDPYSIVNVQLSCKKIADLTKDQSFWKGLLIRDFGDVEAKKISDGNYKDAYIECFENMKSLLASFPKVAGIDLLKSEKDLPLKLYGIVPVSKFDEYLNRLPKDELWKVFNESVSSGCSFFIRQFLNHTRLVEIPIESNFSLEAERSEVDFEEESKSQFFNKLLFSVKPLHDSKEYCEGLSLAFIAFVKKGDLEMVKQFMKHPRFKEIPASGKSGLSGAFFSAVKNGYVNIIEEFVQHPRFPEIDALSQQWLGVGFYNASKFGHLEVVKKIMSHPQFKTVCEGPIFPKAFASVCKYGHEEILREILNCSSSDEIFANHKKEFSKAVFNAVKGRHLKILQILADLSAFKEIKAHGKKGMENLFQIAARHDFSEALRILMNSPKFDDISLESFEKAFFRSATKYKAASLELIMKHPRFLEVNENVLIGVYKICSVPDLGNMYSLRQKRVLEMLKSNSRYIILRNKILLELKNYCDDFETAIKGRDQKRIGKLSSDPKFLGVSEKTLTAFFNLATACDFSDGLKAIMAHPKFNSISGNKKEFTQAFYFAATENKISALREFMSHPKFSEITDPFLQLVLRRCLTPKYGQLLTLSQIAVLALLQSHARFRNLSPHPSYESSKILWNGLADALWEKDIQKINQLSASDVLDLIPVEGDNGIGALFILAALLNFPQALRIILAHKNFVQICIKGSNGYALGFEIAAVQAHVTCLNEIMDHPKFYEIGDGTLKLTLQQCLKLRAEGNVSLDEVITILKAHQRFQKF